MTLTRVHEWKTPTSGPPIVLPNDLVGSVLEAEFANVYNKFGYIEYSELTEGILPSSIDYYVTGDTTKTLAELITAALLVSKNLYLLPGTYLSNAVDTILDIPHNFTIRGSSCSTVIIQEAPASSNNTMIRIGYIDSGENIILRNLTIRPCIIDLWHNFTFVAIEGDEDTNVRLENIKFDIEEYYGSVVLRLLTLEDGNTTIRNVKCTNCSFAASMYSYADGRAIEGVGSEVRLTIDQCLFGGFESAITVGNVSGSCDQLITIRNSYFLNNAIDSGYSIDNVLNLSGPGLIDNCDFLMQTLYGAPEAFIKLFNSTDGYFTVRNCRFDTYSDGYPTNGIELVGDRFCIETNRELNSTGLASLSGSLINIDGLDMGASHCTFRDNGAYDVDHTYSSPGDSNIQSSFYYKFIPESGITRTAHRSGLLNWERNTSNDSLLHTVYAYLRWESLSTQLVFYIRTSTGSTRGGLVVLGDSIGGPVNIAD